VAFIRGFVTQIFDIDSFYICGINYWSLYWSWNSVSLKQRFSGFSVVEVDGTRKMCPT